MRDPSGVFSGAHFQRGDKMNQNAIEIIGVVFEWVWKIGVTYWIIAIQLQLDEFQDKGKLDDPSLDNR